MKISKGTARNIVLYSIANYLHTGINAVANIFVSNILGPVNNGIISYYNAITTNINHVVFGTFRSAVEREVPQIKEYEEKRHYAQQAFAASFICSIICSSVFFFIGLFTPDRIMKYCSFFVAVLTLVTCISDFYRVWVKSLNRIPQVSVIMIIVSLLIPVFSILFSSWFGLDGFWIGRIILQGISLVCFCIASKELFKIVHIEKSFLKRIFVSGGEIILFSLFSTGITTMDRFFVKGTLGLEILGYYAIGAMICTMLMLVPSSITGAVYPKFVGMVGHDLKEQVRKYSTYIDLVCIIVSYLVFLCIPFLIKWIMPSYVPSIPIVKVLLVAFVAHASTQLRYMDMIRNKKMKVLIVYSGIAFALGILSFIVISLKYDSIIPFAWGTNICFLFLAFGVNMSWKKMYNEDRRLCISSLYITICPFLVLTPLIAFNNPLTGYLISSFVFIIVYGIRLKFKI